MSPNDAEGGTLYQCRHVADRSGRPLMDQLVTDRLPSRPRMLAADDRRRIILRALGALGVSKKPSLDARFLVPHQALRYNTTNHSMHASPRVAVGQWLLSSSDRVIVTVRWTK